MFVSSEFRNSRTSQTSQNLIDDSLDQIDYFPIEEQSGFFTTFVDPKPIDNNLEKQQENEQQQEEKQQQKPKETNQKKPRRKKQKGKHSKTHKKTKKRKTQDDEEDELSCKTKKPKKKSSKRKKAEANVIVTIKDGLGNEQSIDLAGKLTREQLRLLTSKQKKQRRMIKNRKSAQKCREKTRQRIEELSEEISQMQEVRVEIESQVENYKKENLLLHQEIEILKKELSRTREQTGLYQNPISQAINDPNIFVSDMRNFLN
ncbi:basic-leucine zipper transcription factor f-related [Anaeramoeba ignava]|uniref:Basic-leucine zipper transcription factor f-related n=1 Tax=Anaeramoeba ignava TaxID=1746090 RepID=A0A9Q0LRR7_ANAIG|nr:basic-leucine zipper transcription factor f-related [Anaeramoeba ignava]